MASVGQSMDRFQRPCGANTLSPFRTSRHGQPLRCSPDSKHPTEVDRTPRQALVGHAGVDTTFNADVVQRKYGSR